MTAARSLLAIVFGAVLSVVMIYRVLTHHTPTPDDYEERVGSPTSFELRASQGQPFAELHFSKDEIRYRIAVERFKDIPDKNGFVQAASRKGAELRFHVEKGAREHPSKPAADPTPTVFIESLTVDGVEYYPLARTIDWKKQNDLYATMLAVASPLLTGYLIYDFLQRRRRGALSRSG
jgi:hypothetical protein